MFARKGPIFKHLVRFKSFRTRHELYVFGRRTYTDTLTITTRLFRFSEHCVDLSAHTIFVICAIVGIIGAFVTIKKNDTKQYVRVGNMSPKYLKISIYIKIFETRSVSIYLKHP